MYSPQPPWPSSILIWNLVLEMAIRDRASSIHYHPWNVGSLAYVVDDKRYEMVPPPADISRTFVLAAGSMLAKTRAEVWSRRFLGWPIRASGLLRFPCDGRVTEWFGIVWKVHSFTGVEWNRVDDAFVLSEPCLLGLDRI